MTAQCYSDGHDRNAKVTVGWGDEDNVHDNDDDGDDEAVALRDAKQLNYHVLCVRVFFLAHEDDDNVSEKQGTNNLLGMRTDSVNVLEYSRISSCWIIRFN